MQEDTHSIKKRRPKNEILETKSQKVQIFSISIGIFGSYEICRFIWAKGFCRVSLFLSFSLKKDIDKRNVFTLYVSLLLFFNFWANKKMGSLRKEETEGRLFEQKKIEEDEEEPILMEQPQRFCMFPIKYHQLWEMYKKAEASFWTGILLVCVIVVNFLLSLLVSWKGVAGNMFNFLCYNPIYLIFHSLYHDIFVDSFWLEEC